MQKTVLAPELGDVDSDELDTTVSSVGIVTEREGFRKIALSELVWPEGDLETQTRTVLDHVAEIVVDDLGGSMDDVTGVRWYVRADALAPANRALLHEVRSEFFERPTTPPPRWSGWRNWSTTTRWSNSKPRPNCPGTGGRPTLFAPDEPS